jgi:hypothetical protein
MSSDLAEVASEGAAGADRFTRHRAHTSYLARRTSVNVLGGVNQLTDGMVRSRSSRPGRRMGSSGKSRLASNGPLQRAGLPERS